MGHNSKRTSQNLRQMELMKNSGDDDEDAGTDELRDITSENGKYCVSDVK